MYKGGYIMFKKFVVVVLACVLVLSLFSFSAMPAMPCMISLYISPKVK